MRDGYGDFDISTKLARSSGSLVVPVPVEAVVGVLGPDQTQIWAECKPKVVTTLFDYGQGERDLRALLVAIDDDIASAGRGQARS